MSKQLRLLATWMGLLFVCIIMSHCVIDPMVLFPLSETTNDSGITEKSPSDKTKSTEEELCYNGCITKQKLDSATCKKTCYEKNPAQDCYYSCIKDGNSSSVCGNKCYNKLDPATECFLNCSKKGGTLDSCKRRVTDFEKCIKLGKDTEYCAKGCFL